MVNGNGSICIDEQQLFFLLSLVPPPPLSFVVSILALRLCTAREGEREREREYIILDNIMMADDGIC